MPSNHTTNYNLSQWAKSDQVKMEDFNADNAKIDGALKAASDARAAMQTALNTKGNCSVGLFTYTGTGTYGPDNPTRITFPRRPAAFIVFSSVGFLFGEGSGDDVVVLGGSVGSAYVFNSSLSTTWSGNTVSFFDINNEPKLQLNYKDFTYYVLAFYAES